MNKRTEKSLLRTHKISLRLVIIPFFKSFNYFFFYCSLMYEAKTRRKDLEASSRALPRESMKSFCLVKR